MSIGYVNFTVLLMMISAMLLFVFDVREYKKKKMKKEERFARFFGWFNVVAGIGAYIINWIYQLRF
jgi:hypothetical protein